MKQPTSPDDVQFEWIGKKKLFRITPLTVDGRGWLEVHCEFTSRQRWLTVTPDVAVALLKAMERSNVRVA